MVKLAPVTGFPTARGPSQERCMNLEPSESAAVSELLERARTGNPDAVNTLIERTVQRLRHLARQMLNSSPALRRWTGSDDLLQNALIRLMRALQAVQPDCSRRYFRLAALQMRRELIDFARHCRGPGGYAANHASGDGGFLIDAGGRVDSDQPDRIAQWAELHAHIGTLEESHREIVDLIYYQGLSQADAAEVLGVSVRTVQRRWHTVLLELNQFLEGSGLNLS